jgi:hypothetical protein
MGPSSAMIPICQQMIRNNNNVTNVLQNVYVMGVVGWTYHRWHWYIYIYIYIYKTSRQRRRPNRIGHQLSVKTICWASTRKHIYWQPVAKWPWLWLAATVAVHSFRYKVCVSWKYITDCDKTIRCKNRFSLRMTNNSGCTFCALSIDDSYSFLV